MCYLSCPLRIDQFRFHARCRNVQPKLFFVEFILCYSSISANADGPPRDAASREIDHIARSTKYNYQATSDDR